MRVLELEPGTVAKLPQEPQIYLLSIAAYRALGENGFLPEYTELLYGRIYEKIPISPAEVSEVWLVLPDDKTIEVHRLPANGQFKEMKIYGGNERLQSSAVPEFTLDLAAFFRPEQP